MGTIGKNEKAPILYPPKAKVTRSNRVGCANDFNGLGCFRIAL